MIADRRGAAFPRGVQLAFYGDDFTGSTDAMEATALAGLPTVLFTRPPDDGVRARFADRAAVGLAGDARARDPAWMEANLPGAFEALAQFGAPVMQYKVCSTFDSAPHVGSIGRALDIGARTIAATWLPVVVGAPHLGRWVVFGHLFAAAGGAAHRIDRHPTMARHPVTPMGESDLARHLAAQTERPVQTLGLDRLARGEGDLAAQTARAAGAALLIDAFDPATQTEAGRLVWEGRGAGVFAIGSSGLQHALIAHWRAAGLLPQTPPPASRFEPVDRLLVLSGSCSPVTAAQIAAAEKAGFATAPLDVLAAAESPSRAAAEVERLLAKIGDAFAAPAAPPGLVIHAARTVDDPAYAALLGRSGGAGRRFDAAQAAIGEALGDLARAAVPRFGLSRLVVAGGDTAGRVVGRLPVAALEVASPLAPGAPLCRAAADDASSGFHGLELVLKGGQIGRADLFVDAAGGGIKA